jgi:hypothetical protein
LNWIERAQHRVGKDFDDFLLHSARVLRVARAVPDGPDLSRIDALADYYLEKGYPDQPSRFFSLPRKPPQARVVEDRPFSDGRVRTYAFPSRYKVKNPDFSEEYLKAKENRTAYLVHWSHGDHGRNTILCCHGYSLGDPGQAERMFRVPRLYGLGLDVALFITPFHWKRASSLLQRFRPPFPFPHPVLGLEGFGQAMHDLSSSFLLLREMGVPRIGLIGASLGGYLGALFASLDRKADLVTLIVPFLDFQSLRVPAGPFSGVGDRGDGRPAVEGKIEALWRIHSPFSHKCRLAPDRCLLIASRGDRLCPFEDVKRLYDHWGGPQHFFLRGGHALFFPRRGRGEAWYGFLEEHGFLEQ